MSQYGIIFAFANQRFGEVCWHNMRIILNQRFRRAAMGNGSNFPPNSETSPNNFQVNQAFDV